MVKVTPSSGDGIVTVQQHHILRRSGQLTYLVYASPTRLPQPAALLNSYGTVLLSDSGIEPDSCMEPLARSLRQFLQKACDSVNIFLRVR